MLWRARQIGINLRGRLFMKGVEVNAIEERMWAKRWITYRIWCSQSLAWVQNLKRNKLTIQFSCSRFTIREAKHHICLQHCTVSTKKTIPVNQENHWNYFRLENFSVTRSNTASAQKSKFPRFCKQILPSLNYLQCKTLGTIKDIYQKYVGGGILSQN
jgi:hypothetical protein